MKIKWKSFGALIVGIILMSVFARAEEDRYILGMPKLRVTVLKRNMEVVSDSIFEVSGDGFVDVPDLGKFEVRNKSLMQCSRIMMASDRGKGFIIRVGPGFIPEQGVKCVTVGGQVRRPGLIDFVEGLTLYRSIQLAGGSNEFGTLRKVKVIRDGWEKQFDMTVEEDLYVPLKEGDVIEVPVKRLRSN